MYTKKYKKFEFHLGGSSKLSFQKIKKSIYYVIIEQMEGLTEKNQIIMQYHIRINLAKNKVKLIKKKIVSNTLPVSNLRKIIEKYFIIIFK